MRVLIIDDDLEAANGLAALLQVVEPKITAIKIPGNPEEAVHWLNANPGTDLLLVNIELKKANGFEVLRDAGLSLPVIFTGDKTDATMDALRHLCVDYLVKPISAQSLGRAMSKFQLMSKAFGHLPKAEEKAVDFEQKFQTCFAAKQGKRTLLIPVSQICFFSAHNKSVIIADSENNRFAVDHTIEKLEALLDPKVFFRINRKMIVQGKAIRSIRPHVNNRLCLNFFTVQTKELVIVSRERSPGFRKWISGIAN